MEANLKASKFTIFFLLLSALILVPYSFVIAENEYGDCAYGNSSYNTNCPDASIATPMRSGNTIGNPWPKFAVFNDPPTDTPPTTPTPSTSSFTRDLSFGMDGKDVRMLQKYLNNLGFLVAESGPGSKGSETTRFGIGTRAALIKFQIVKGINPAVGYFGPVTRALFTATTPSQTPVISSNKIFQRNLNLNDTGEDVRKLQQFLNTHGFIITSSGPGSPGNETLFFGPATLEAVIKFQETYVQEILTPSGLQKGNGTVGPRTREKLNSF